jgi:hypothetical protein
MANYYEMDHEEWARTLRERLRDRFGKDTFTDEEMDKQDFWVEYKLACYEWFRTPEGLDDMDSFWNSRDFLAGREQ